MRLIVLGSTEFTARILDHLVACDMKPVGCAYTQQQFRISYSAKGVHNCRYQDIGSWCEQHDVPGLVFDNNKQLIEFADTVQADCALVAGWYHMIPKALREKLYHGCLGLHASLLPDLRGGAPLNWAILSGRKETGITLFQMGDGVDDGPVYGQKVLPIGPRTTITDLVDASHDAALELLDTCLPALAKGKAMPQQQEGKATYCQQRTPDDGLICWTRPAEEVDRLVRAVTHPYPGAHSYLGEVKVKLWATEPTSDVEVLGAPGQLARIPGDEHPLVCTGEGILRILSVTDEHGEDLMPVLLKSNHKRLSDKPE